MRARKLSRLLALAALPAVLSSQDVRALDVLSIEEHWQLSVGGPESDRSAPQVTMVMSPYSHLDCTYFVFALNHRSVPDFAAGGMEVQRWDGDAAVVANDGPQGTTLEHDNETIQWVQRMHLDEGKIHFEIVNGSSQTWGAFGGQGYLKSSEPTSLTRLNAYKPYISLDESGIAYAGNRVSSLILTKLVWTTDDGQTHEMVAPIDIDADLDP